MLHRLLLLPLLSPLLVTLLVAALNPSPSVALRLLAWQSPALPVGAWMALAAAGGAAMSGSATALALRQGGTPLQRQVRRQPWSGGSPAPQGPRQSAARAPVAEPAGPSRSPGEPAPTVSVPYRVLRRGSPADASPATPRPERVVETVRVADDWGEQSSEDW